MVDSVIVSFKKNKGTELVDVELPCNVVIADIKDQLRYIRELSLSEKDFSLTVNGKKLNENKSFSDIGIWDGAVVEIETEESKWRL